MIKRERAAIIGLKGGADHPFGAVLLVAAADGLVMVDEYLERQQASSLHCAAIQQKFKTTRFADVRWSVDEREKELQLEFMLAGVPVMGIPNVDAFGIQRVQTWLAAKQLFFVKSQCPDALRQLSKYRFAENTLPDGQKRATEAVFRADDELPKALAVAVLTWPELPKIEAPTMTERERKRWEALDERSREDIRRLRAYDQQSQGADADPGDFFEHNDGVKTEIW